MIGMQIKTNYDTVKKINEPSVIKNDSAHLWDEYSPFAQEDVFVNYFSLRTHLASFQILL